MVGWFCTFTRDFQGAPNQGNHNELQPETQLGSHEGNRINRNHIKRADRGDGQFVIAAMETAGLRGHGHAHALRRSRRKGDLEPFPQKTDAWRITTASASADGGALAGAIAQSASLFSPERKGDSDGDRLGALSCIMRAANEPALHGFLWRKR